MSSLRAMLLLAGTASAQITTALWIVGWSGLGTNKLGFYASVVGVNETSTTLKLDFDNGTDTSAMGLAGAPFTMTFAPNVWEQHTTYPVRADTDDDNRWDLRCERNPETQTANATCTATYGRAAARRIMCNTGIRYDRTNLNTVTNAYPARLSYSSGIETITQTYIFSSVSRSTPAWCEDQSALPSEDLISTVAIGPENFGTYQVIITAGTEKLQPTAGATPSPNSAASTTPANGLTGVSASGSPASTPGAAASVTAMGSMGVGLVAGVAVLAVQLL